jgi:hypothetical protein
MTYLSKTDLNKFNDKIIADIDIIYDYFKIPYRQTSTLMISHCAVHGGDNQTAMNLYYNSDIVNFKCRTHHCEKQFGKSLIGLIRGLLSHEKYNWKSSGDLTVNFNDTIAWLQSYLKTSLTISRNNNNYTHDDKREFIQQSSLWAPQEEIKPAYEMSKYTQIPSPYFINRGFSPNVLTRNKVGYHKELNRSIVPVYDIHNTYVGWTGRSIYEQCLQCKQYHNPVKTCCTHPKWLHKVKKNDHLYNLNNAHRYISSKKLVILVESPGNLWKLQELGLFNVVALLGCDISENQKNLLYSLEILGLILVLDGDCAGQQATKNITDTLSGIFKVYNYRVPEGTDISDLPKSYLVENFIPFIQSIERFYT